MNDKAYMAYKTYKTHKPHKPNTPYNFKIASSARR